MECHCLARSFTSFGKPQSILTYPLIFNPQERIKFSWTCWEDYQENKARGPAPQMKKSEHSQSRYTGRSSKETSNIHTYCSVLFLLMHGKKPAAHSHRTVVSLLSVAGVRFSTLLKNSTYLNVFTFTLQNVLVIWKAYFASHSTHYNHGVYCPLP